MQVNVGLADMFGSGPGCVHYVKGTLNSKPSPLNQTLNP